MQYRILFTRQARNMYTECIDYILYEFKDPFAANGLNSAIEEALNILSTHPLSHPLCENPKLNKRQIRKIHLHKYNYKLFYHVQEQEIIIDALIHDSQDYERILS